MSLKHKHLQQRGDTIVEVMIVLAIVALASTICFSTASRSILSARQAQENSRAAEVLQYQVEYLRIFAQNDSSSPDYIFMPSPTQQFCINPGGHVAKFTIPNTYPTPDCGPIDGLYKVADTYDPISATFKVVATWDDVAGQGTDTATAVYRVQ